MEEGERQRPPRPRRQPEVVRASIEVGLFAVLVIVVLAVLGVVLHAGRQTSTPPPNTVVVTQSADFATLDPALAQTADAWELEYATCAKLLKRTPYYRGPRRAHVQAIVYRFGAFPPQIRLQLERGEADYGVVPPQEFAGLIQKFRRDHTHLFVVQQPTVAYLAFNTQRPLFHDNPWLRRAINYALDRRVLARFFGKDGSIASDEYLPPGFPGYEPKHIYPIGAPDLAKARRLAAGDLP